MALVELSEDGKRLEVFFGYSRARNEAIKSVPGAAFFGKTHPRSKYPGNAYWTLPLEIETARQLRRAFGDDLEMGEKVKAWAHSIVRVERNLRSIATRDTAELRRLPEVLPELNKAIHIGPRGRYMTDAQKRKALTGPASYQAADVAFMAASPNPLNGNHPRLGKTLELIASVYEGEHDEGAHLVIAPVSSLDTVWKAELDEWQVHESFVVSGTKAQKQKTLDAFEAHIAAGHSGWLIVNPDVARFREEVELCDWHMDEFDGPRLTRKAIRAAEKCPVCEYNLVSEFPLIHKLDFATQTVDEPQKNGLRNVGTLSARGMTKVRARKRFLLSGTPMGGKIINLWPLLHFLNPKVFPSKHRWADMWTDVTTVEFRGRGGEVKKRKVIGGSIKHCEEHAGIDDEFAGRPDCDECRIHEDAFYKMLEPYMTRRTQREAMPWVPEKDIAIVECDFGSRKHRRQYEEFNRDAWTTINGQDITSTGVLDEYMRLKQFSFSTHTRRGKKLVPTADSGKLAMLHEKLDERGIWSGETAAQAVIFSQFSEVVDLVHDWLNSNKVQTAKITGATVKKGERARLQSDFQAGGRLRCLVMTTTAGGVAITLNRADNCHILDETWDPDDQEQAINRVYAASPNHRVTAYFYRANATIEEYIAQTTLTKSMRNMRVLDLRRLLARSPVRV